MKMTMSFNDFMDNWPEDRKSKFNYHSMKALYDYYEELEESTGEEIEYDPIAICSDWSELSEGEMIDIYHLDLEALRKETEVLDVEYVTMENGEQTHYHYYLVHEF